MGGLLFKLKILLNAIRILRNWHAFPLVYFGLIKKEHVNFFTKSGMKMKIRTNSTDLDTFCLIWLLKDYGRFNFVIKPDDVIIDIGAHIGTFSLYASQFCTQGKIFCYEPSNENFELLKENIKQNKIKNIFPENLAVSKSNDKVTFYINPDKTANSMYDKTSESISVQSTTLQQIFDLNKLENCNYLKLDCEGAEYDIIESLPEEYFKKIEKMYIEYHFSDSKPLLLENMIKKLESASFKIINQPMEQGMGSIFAIKK